jgi:hypothetical protein
MSRLSAGQLGKGQAPRPSAAEAKMENERYEAFKSRLRKIAAAVERAGQAELADRLADLGQQVEDREITLEEGLAELRAHESEIRAMLKR